MWAWEQVRESEPNVKVLMTLQHDREPAVLAPFESAILGAFGITSDDVHVFSEPVAPERLFAATGMYSLPRWVSPDITKIWDRVGDHVVAAASTDTRPRRIFVSRRTSLKRSCHNVAEVESMMMRRGFAVIHPDDHPLAEQVALFRAADVVAGFAGSGLFSLAFCPTPKRVLSLGSDSYTARNEFLISAVRGHMLTSIQSRPDVEQPEGTWSTEAFVSGFTFDFEDEGRYLERVLDDLDH
jgi:capsular polysaccharide biosynthesis protein